MGERHALLLWALGPLVEWVPVCPEFEVGMGVPREPIVLVGSPDSPRLLGERSGEDHTDEMSQFTRRRVEELAALGLDGWVTKSGSPSCGLRGVRVWSVRGGAASPDGVGLFARVLRERLHDLPVAEEVQLEDAAFRRDFLERCVAKTVR